MRETIIFSLISTRLTEISLTCRSQLDLVLRSKAFLLVLFSSLIHFKHFISTAYKHNCSDIVIDDCRGIPGYTKTVVSEKTQSRYQNYIKSKIKHDHEGDNCSSLRKEIVCAENLPACIDGTTAFLCRDNCLSFFDKCLSPFFYGSDMCMEFPRREVTGKESPICKQTHWPRSENWQLPEITNTPTPTPGTYVSHAAPMNY